MEEREQLYKLQTIKHNHKIIKLYNAAFKLIVDEVDAHKSLNEAVYASAET